jgi:hypothetical protein
MDEKYIENPGTPRHEPNDANRFLVSELVSFGITQEKIAARLSISEDTLVKYYRYELDTAKTNAVQKIATGLFAKAEGGDLAAQIFYLKTQGRWSDKTVESEAAKAALSLVEQLAALNKKS